MTQEQLIYLDSIKNNEPLFYATLTGDNSYLPTGTLTDDQKDRIRKMFPHGAAVADNSYVGMLDNILTDSEVKFMHTYEYKEIKIITPAVLYTTETAATYNTAHPDTPVTAGDVVTPAVYSLVDDVANDAAALVTVYPVPSSSTVGHYKKQLI